MKLFTRVKIGFKEIRSPFFVGIGAIILGAFIYFVQLKFMLNITHGFEWLIFAIGILFAFASFFVFINKIVPLVKLLINFAVGFVVSIFVFLATIPFLISTANVTQERLTAIGNANMYRIVLFYGFFLVSVALLSYFFKRIRFFVIAIFVYWVLGTGLVFGLTHTNPFFKNTNDTIATTHNEKFPVEQLALKNVQWQNGILSGDVLNKSKDKVFNIKIQLTVSKTRNKWEIGTQDFALIPFIINPNDTFHFDESIKPSQVNPWWTTQVISAEYYTGQPIVYPTYPVTPTVHIANNYQQPTNNDEQPWGIAKQIDEHTWTMKVGQDDRMATAQEIYDALNAYRQRNGVGRLGWNDHLASYALTRAAYFEQRGGLDGHAGFIEYTKSIDNLKSLGFWGVGENSAYGYRMLGVHLIEWVYAGDKPHDDNQKDPKWTSVGIGVSGNSNDLIFGTNGM